MVAARGLGFVLALASVLGCGAPAKPRPQPVPDDNRISRPIRPLLPRPELRFVRLSNVPTWPLTKAPSLDPHFALPGSPWTSLCEKRGHVPEDVLVYIEAWCKSRKTSNFDLPGALLRLTASNVGGLADAVRRDVANLLADAETGANASDWLSSNRVGDFSWQVTLRDYLVAVYADLERIDDAAAVMPAINSDPMRQPGDDCRRLARLSVRFDARDIDSAIADPATGSCVEQARSLACLAKHALASSTPPGAECSGQPVPTEEQAAVVRAQRAYLAWPHQEPKRIDWFRLAELAATAISVDNVEELALTALENSILTGGCDPYWLGEVHALALQMKASPHHRRDLDDRVTMLTNVKHKTCDAFRRVPLR